MRKPIFVTLILHLLLLSGFIANASASIGTRAKSMGGAFVAVSDDASGVWYNPAGLRIGARDTSLDFSSFDSDHDYEKRDIIALNHKSTWASNDHNFGFGLGLNATEYDKLDDLDDSGSDYSTDMIVGAAWGKDKLSIGLAVEWDHQDQVDEYLVNTTLGILYNLFESEKWGTSCRVGVAYTLGDEKDFEQTDSTEYSSNSDRSNYYDYYYNDYYSYDDYYNDKHKYTVTGETPDILSYGLAINKTFTQLHSALLLSLERDSYETSNFGSAKAEKYGLEWQVIHPMGFLTAVAFRVGAREYIYDDNKTDGTSWGVSGRIHDKVSIDFAVEKSDTWEETTLSASLSF